MTNLKGKRLLVTGLIACLALAAVDSVLRARSTAAALRSDREDLRELRTMLAEIEQVADTPTVAALQIESADEILNRINAALAEAGLSPSLLASQTPGQPQRIGQSDFTLRKIEIILNAAAVDQVVAFCDALRDESRGSVVRDLSLYDPQRNGRRETWKSEMILTQMIFSPKSTR
ncbi:hypothetical protein FYK55_19525 [Roseiconus nitratireducens]|uniref:Type II secretion system (T2SS) protein M subtype b n=1 Tax=Roseiconus nitratireducens TaxID=2605748 RepID=A0A5M6D7A7_9BACT|nr:hypothetical protein [Roseiconus nitratireducens]KAA5541085.1 hypothetical protein FYK55_19525 [Roseiconus nitratireducens]